MTLYDFKLKSDHEQYDMVFTQGDFVDYHIEQSKRFALYAVFKFFVEIEYDLWSNEVTGKRSFIEGDLLDKYSRGFSPGEN
ncbi:hypothetical protein [Salinimicrobium sp. GXAS 041]|uniref:hypothetical protein n=1 Tax=Salinimicrobium sp. GXAS 041 TaxID=3400806 RepID=UPI003C72F037